MPGMKAQSLADLADIQRTLRERAAAEAAERQAALARALAEQRERELFARSVGAVRPIPASERLLHTPPAGEEEVLLELLSERIPPGVDEAAYVKASWLSAVAKGQAASKSRVKGRC